MSDNQSDRDVDGSRGPGAWIAALTDVGYEGAVCVEVEDDAFAESLEHVASPNARLCLARAERDAGHLVDAHRAYGRAIDEALRAMDASNAK